VINDKSQGSVAPYLTYGCKSRGNGQKRVAQKKRSREYISWKQSGRKKWNYEGRIYETGRF